MRKFTVLLLLVLFQCSLFAQTIKRCGDLEYLDYLRTNFPVEYANIQATEQQVNEYLVQHPNDVTRTLTTIPVVVHVVYNQSQSGSNQQNISDAQILSQITVLNKDYHKLNSDWNNTPSAWTGLVADIQIQFCMAERDPDGNSTNGITRTSTTTTSFSTNDNVKKNSTGGEDAWPDNEYLNIWVCNLSSGILGYATLPGGADWRDGVVIHYKAFGTIGSLLSSYNLGRTTTHEVGHFFNLHHTWGDDDNGNGICESNECSGTDYVGDTPNECEENYGCPSFPKTDDCSPSSPGVMFMNYMDYSDDACLYMFTLGQSARMNASLNSTRASLKTSQGCNAVGIFDPVKITDLTVYPNPSNGIFEITLPSSLHGYSALSVTNSIGQVMESENLRINYETKYLLDLSRQPVGFYLVRISCDGKEYGARIILDK